MAAWRAEALVWRTDGILSRLLLNRSFVVSYPANQALQTDAGNAIGNDDARKRVSKCSRGENNELQGGAEFTR